MSTAALTAIQVAAPRLAIVIPAFKVTFLERTLRSIAQQTDRRFLVYVGDDTSPHDLQSVCAPFKDKFELRYHRFATNLGQRDLVAHWTRCIDLTSEPWLWLFGDDDVMEPECVGAVLKRIEEDEGAHDLYHFDVIEIDAHDRVIRDAPRYPDVLQALEFARARATFSLSSYAPDYVFSRAALDAAGGFQRFPLAWCSDDATWIKLGRRGGIRRVPGPRVRWRSSGQNISSATPKLAIRKLVAASAYVGWLNAYLDRLPPSDSEPSAPELRRAANRWLVRHGQSLGVRFWPAAGLACGWHLRRSAPMAPIGGWLATIYWDLRFLVRGW